MSPLDMVEEMHLSEISNSGLGIGFYAHHDMHLSYFLHPPSYETDMYAWLDILPAISKKWIQSYKKTITLSQL
jgi:hypothetical protein